MGLFQCLNPPQLATDLTLIWAAMRFNSFVQKQRSYQWRQHWHVHLDFSWFSWLFFPSLPTLNKDNNQHWNPLTCHLGGCVGQPPIQMLFFLSHRRFKRGTLWENKLWAAFPLRQPHNSLPVCGRASQRTRRLARKISLHLLTHTMALGWLPEVTHWLTFSVDCLITLEIKQVRLH